MGRGCGGGVGLAGGDEEMGVGWGWGAAVMRIYIHENLIGASRNLVYLATSADRN